MHTKIIEGTGILIKLLLKKPDRAAAVSFENCIELRTNTKLAPKIPLFKVVDNKMYAKSKLSSYNNIVKMMIINFKGHVADGALARLLIESLPTLFDQKTIHRMNWEFCIYQFREHILQSSITILGREEVIAMGLHDRLNAYGGPSECDRDPEESSLLDEISIGSEEMIIL